MAQRGQRRLRGALLRATMLLFGASALFGSVLVFLVPARGCSPPPPAGAGSAAGFGLATEASTAKQLRSDAWFSDPSRPALTWLASSSANLMMDRHRRVAGLSHLPQGRRHQVRGRLRPGQAVAEPTSRAAESTSAPRLQQTYLQEQQFTCYRGKAC
eukprot:CAMPEP_0170620112 /NCGR_PEP_ID=MMETSP0224-20130122/27884_1 /TAXON_ID=285029 /ORGANISM="Togula jolla, Strain CCCM 725" /LENGTH=156 /DNA_ID=CAMNT_0010946263 /DNA_START=58 /DNA_END=527 /DNA_ORIENTATION=-